MLSHRTSGAHYEKLAAKFLKTQGLSLITQNHNCKGGELDLVMRDTADTLVFVEVRFRSSDHYGGAEHSITPQKQRALAHAARHYLACHPEYDTMRCRFDMVFMSPSPHGKEKQPNIKWLQNALFLDMINE